MISSSNNKFIVVAYYTENTLYEHHSKVLEHSLLRYSLPYHIQSVPNLGNWFKNCNYKPTFLKQMLEMYFPLSLVYVDCDAEFVQPPILFDTLDCDVGLFELDRNLYYNKPGKEVCSGTIFLRNTLNIYELLNRWEKECQLHSGQWDQWSLAKVIKGNFYRLPPEYCCIDKTMKSVEEPVIVHHQASREVKKNGGKLIKV